jgi:hypothetical protein
LGKSFLNSISPELQNSTDAASFQEENGGMFSTTTTNNQLGRHPNHGHNHLLIKWHPFPERLQALGTLGE